MAIRDELYLKFENFDKPDEGDFRDLIDLATKPNGIEEIVIADMSDIITDINLIGITLDIRDLKLVKHGADVYLFFGMEGDYGLNGIAITQANLGYIGAIGSSGLLNELVSDVSIGGIKQGDVFSAGTSYDTMWRTLLNLTQISNLRYQASNQSTLLEVGTPITINKFLWDSLGTPGNMRLADGEGLDVAVTGNEHTIDKVYSYSSRRLVTWILSSDAGNISTSTRWLHPSYYGKNTTGVAPDQAEVLAGTKLVVNSDPGITVALNTTDTDFGWIAVPLSQTRTPYTKWFISELNKAAIGPEEFIKESNDTYIDGITYKVYMFNYSSEVATIKLS